MGAIIRRLQTLAAASRVRWAVARPAGAGYVRVERTGAGRTAVTHARAVSPLRVFTPSVTPETAWLVTSTLGGGLVGGDDIALTLDVDDGARALVATQASTKIYRSSTRTRQSLEARVGRGGLLVVLPDPVTPFAGSTFEQAQSFGLAEDAGLLVLDWFTAGRRASGERWAFDRYSSRLEIARAGRRVFYDHLWLSGDDGPLAERMRQFNVYALAVAVGPWSDGGHPGVRPGSDHEDSKRRGPLDLLMSVTPFGPSGTILRVAGTRTEQVAAVVRDFCAPIASLIGADPWARRW